MYTFIKNDILLYVYHIVTFARIYKCLNLQNAPGQKQGVNSPQATPSADPFLSLRSLRDLCDPNAFRERLPCFSFTGANESSVSTNPPFFSDIFFSKFVVPPNLPNLGRLNG